MTRSMQRLRYTAVLFLLCACACLAMAEAHRCIHDVLMKRRRSRPLPVVRQHPDAKRDGWTATGVAAKDWAPIRIGVFSADMKDATKYCTKAGEQRSDFSGETVKCTARDIFTAEKHATLTNRILPSAIQLHRDRLLVKPLEGNIVLPEFTEEDDICRFFSVPKVHFKEGVPGVDMALYAAAAPTEASTLAWALSCAQEGGRPVAGVMNFGPHSLEDTSATIRVSAHEMAHALGFDYDIFEENKIISSPRSVRGKSSVIMVTSKKTLEKTREHYGCPTAAGMELEDEGGDGTALSHWERRNAMDELMAGIAGLGVYSALTMAVFEDMGFYRANWGMEEPMVWGRGKGCDLLDKPCVSNGETKFPDMFCTSKQSTMSCTADRRFLGSCSILKSKKKLPSQFQYFKDPTLGGGDENDLTDFCPYILGFDETSCINGDLSMMPGSTTGRDSRCLKGENLTMGRKVVGDICADVSCEKDRTVRVRYHGDSTWHKCADGQTIVPSATFSDGKILCPRYEEVCVA